MSRRSCNVERPGICKWMRYSSTNNKPLFFGTIILILLIVVGGVIIVMRMSTTTETEDDNKQKRTEKINLAIRFNRQKTTKRAAATEQQPVLFCQRITAMEFAAVYAESTEKERGKETYVERTGRISFI